MKSTEAIPLTVISGFLGAGKTTWLNRQIREGLPPESLILVNDFGAINIDAELIDYRDDRILRLANGCICCSLGGTLAEQLAAVMKLESRPGAVFIEASGVAQPARIADIARVSRHFRLASIDCLVDASQIDAHACNPLTGDLWRTQIAGAHRLLLNRVPTDAPEAGRLRAQLEVLNPMAEIRLLPETFRPESRTLPPPSRRKDGPGSAPGHWRSASLNFNGPLDASRLEALLEEYLDVLLRVKGILGRQDRSGLQVVQLSGSTLSWLPARPGAHGHQLVCIGAEGARFDQLIGALRQLDTRGPDYRLMPPLGALPVRDRAGN